MASDKDKIKNIFKKMGIGSVFNRIPEGTTTFDKNENLTCLSLSNLDVKDLPGTIDEFSMLRGISMSRTGINQLPEGIKNNQYLDTILMTECDLNTIPVNMGLIPQLKILKIEKNSIHNILESLPESLAELYLSSNKLTQIPEFITRLKNLKILDLSNNLIEEISPKIAELKNLELLRLSNNPLSSLPSEIGELRNLTAIFLVSAAYF